MAFLNQSELLTELQSVICTVKGGLTLKELEIKFLKLTNYSLPPEFKSLKTLHSIWPGFFEIKRDTSTNIERIVAMPTKQNQHLINLVNQQKPAKKTKAQKKAEAVAQAQAAAKLKANAASTKVKPPVQPKSNPMEKVSSSDAQCHGFKHQPPAVKHVSAVGPCSTVSNGQCPSQNCVDLSRTSSPSQAPRFSKLLTEWTINNKMPLPQFISYSVSWSQPNAPKHLIMVSIGNQSWSSFPEHCATPKEAVEMASKKALAVLTSHKSKAIEVLAKIDPESVRTAISILQSFQILAS